MRRFRRLYRYHCMSNYRISFLNKKNWIKDQRKKEINFQICGFKGSPALAKAIRDMLIKRGLRGVRLYKTVSVKKLIPARAASHYTITKWRFVKK